MIRGIGGIERKLREQELLTDRHINESFQDLQKLMDKAKDMSQLAESITKKLKEKGNREISEDEAVLLRSELMKLGLGAEMDDLAEISRKNYAHKSHYYQDLGRTVGKFILPIVNRNGGQMALTDVFCTVNRARGMNLISAEDLLNACYTLEPNVLKLKKYQSGLLVLQSSDYDQDQVNGELLSLIDHEYEQTGSGLSAYQLSLARHVSLFQATQSLLICEQTGLICRDESIQGLYFYPNKFSQQ